MVMGNVVGKGKTLLFDHLHIRSRDFEEPVEYPSAVLKVHKDSTLKITGSFVPEAETIYGRLVENRILKTMTCDILPLWARFEGILLLLPQERNFQNAE